MNASAGKMQALPKIIWRHQDNPPRADMETLLIFFKVLTNDGIGWNVATSIDDGLGYLAMSADVDLWQHDRILHHRIGVDANVTDHHRQK